jgi:ABC transporter substrate binding protein
MGSRLPIWRLLITCHAFKETVAAGGLVSLGPDVAASWGQAATYIDKIIRGTEPRDLPVQQPTRYELAINLKTATALGLNIPPTLLVRAGDRVGMQFAAAHESAVGTKRKCVNRPTSWQESKELRTKISI